MNDVTDWTLDGQSLYTYAYSIRAFGDPDGIPARRGENMTVPHRTGRLATTKVLDERHFTLAVWIDARPPLGGERSAGQLQANVDALKALVAGTQWHTLTKTMADGTSRQITVEVGSATEIKPQPPWLYILAFDFRAPDGLWEDAVETTHNEVDIDNLPRPFTLTAGGTTTVERMTITLTLDPDVRIEGVKLMNNTTGVWWSFDIGLVAEDVLEVDTDNWTATLNGTDKTGNLSHGGAYRFMTLAPGANSMELSGTFHQDNPSRYANLAITYRNTYL